MRSNNEPDVLELHSAPIGSKVLVYRTKTKSWEGPLSLLNIEDEKCTLQCPDGKKLFRKTVVKLYKDNEKPQIGMNIQVYWTLDKTFYKGRVADFNTNTGRRSAHYDDGKIDELIFKDENWHVIQDRKTPTACVAFNTTVTGDAESISEQEFIDEIKALIKNEPQNGDHQFKASREKELLGLLEKGVFESVPRSDADGHRIFRCRFVDNVKSEGTPEAFAKSRLVVQGFNDKKQGLRILLALAMILPERDIYLRDISQAYAQSDTNLHRKLFLKPVPEFDISSDTILRVDSPLYGISEAGCKVSQRTVDTKNQTLKSIKLNPESLSIGDFVGAAFANNPDYSSQIGVLTTLLDGENNCNVIQ